jgi:predicted glycosyltransferase
MTNRAASRLEKPPPRFLLYSHDGFGLGHTRRHVAIAAALTKMAPRASVLLASGVDDVYRLGLPPSVDALKLPGLRKVTNGEYQSRRLGIPTQEIRALRSALLTAAVKSFRPDVVLVDKHPFGPGGEFADALSALKEQGGRAALGLRDILDERPAVLSEWNAGSVREGIGQFYDRVLVYGERAVFDPITEYQFSKAIAERTRFCGYVLHHEDPDHLPAALNLDGGCTLARHRRHGSHDTRA